MATPGYPGGAPADYLCCGAMAKLALGPRVAIATPDRARAARLKDGRQGPSGIGMRATLMRGGNHLFGFDAIHPGTLDMKCNAQTERAGVRFSNCHILLLYSQM